MSDLGGLRRDPIRAEILSLAQTPKRLGASAARGVFLPAQFMPSAQRRQIADVTIPSGVWTAVTSLAVSTGWGVDTDIPNRLTIIYSGVYLCIGGAAFASSGTGSRFVALRVNGTTRRAPSGGFVPHSGQIICVHTSYMFNLEANDYVELLVYQDSGANLVLRAHEGLAYLGVTWVSP